MRRVQQGDLVILEYDGTLADGKAVDSSADCGPLEFEVGSGNVFPGFEKGVLDMAAGETKTITLSPEEAYGRQDEKLLHTVKKDAIGKNVNPKPGMILGMTLEREGTQHKIPALVVDVNGDNVTIDFNHPLAGKTLVYQLMLKAIK